ncbi:flagellar protein FlaG [Paenibacillus chartarius]|uniref:Flagellar protein FlaG n=1 Tax=Paenibacillus chartarius TaxID=747481 RepID=A0ABV6DJR7_9BACL
MMDGVNFNGNAAATSMTGIGRVESVASTEKEPAATVESRSPSAPQLPAPRTNSESAFSEEDVKRAIEKANRAIMGPPKKFEYSVHESTGNIVVKVINSETNEVLKELPPEKLLDIVDGIVESAGVIIDEKR